MDDRVGGKIILHLPMFSPTEFTVTQNFAHDFKRKTENLKGRRGYGMGHFGCKNFLVVFYNSQSLPGAQGMLELFNGC